MEKINALIEEEVTKRIGKQQEQAFSLLNKNIELNKKIRELKSQISSLENETHRCSQQGILLTELEKDGVIDSYEDGETFGDPEGNCGGGYHVRGLGYKGKQYEMGSDSF